MNEGLQEKFFPPLFEWDKDELILLTDEGQELVYVNLQNGSLRTVHRGATSKALPAICSDWDKIGSFIIHKAYPLRGEAIVEADNTIKLTRYKKETESVLKIASFETEPYYFYEIEFVRDLFLQTGEKDIILYQGDESHRLVPKGTGDRFMKSRFVYDENGICFVVLSGNNSDAMCSRIEMYCLGETFDD